MMGKRDIKIIMSNTKSRSDSSKNIMHCVADQFKSMKSRSEFRFCSKGILALEYYSSMLSRIIQQLTLWICS